MIADTFFQRSSEAWSRDISERRWHWCNFNSQGYRAQQWNYHSDFSTLSLLPNCLVSQGKRILLGNADMNIDGHATTGQKARHCHWVLRSFGHPVIKENCDPLGQLWLTLSYNSFLYVVKFLKFSNTICNPCARKFSYVSKLRKKMVALGPSKLPQFLAIAQKNFKLFDWRSIVKQSRETKRRKICETTSLFYKHHTESSSFSFDTCHSKKQKLRNRNTIWIVAIVEFRPFRMWSMSDENLRLSRASSISQAFVTLDLIYQTV